MTAPVGRSRPSCWPAHLPCRHWPRAPGLLILVIPAIAVQEEERQLESSQKKGKCSQGEVEEMLNKALEN